MRDVHFEVCQFFFQIQEATAFAVEKKSSAGCLYGNLLGHAERETELGLDEIVSVLKDFGGLKKIEIHLPVESDLDEIEKTTTKCLPSIPNDAWQSTMELTTCCRYKENDQTLQAKLNEHPSWYDQGYPHINDQGYSHNNVQGYNHDQGYPQSHHPLQVETDDEYELLASVSAYGQQQSRSGTGSTARHAVHAPYDSRSVAPIQLLPYHTYITIPQEELQLLHRWRLSNEVEQNPIYSVLSISPDSARSGLLLCSTENSQEEVLPGSGELSLSDGTRSRGRARSQSDSILYGIADLASFDGNDNNIEQQQAGQPGAENLGATTVGDKIQVGDTIEALSTESSLKCPASLKCSELTPKQHKKPDAQQSSLPQELTEIAMGGRTTEFVMSNNAVRPRVRNEMNFEDRMAICWWGIR